MTRFFTKSIRAPYDHVRQRRRITNQGSRQDKRHQKADGKKLPRLQKQGYDERDAKRNPGDEPKLELLADPVNAPHPGSPDDSDRATGEPGVKEYKYQ